MPSCVKKGLDAQRHQEERVAPRAFVQLHHAQAVEVVVVVVRDHHDVDRRQILQGDARRLFAPRAEEAHRRGAVAEDRIGQDVEAARLHQHGRMADPGDRRQRRHRRLHTGPPHRRRVGTQQAELGSATGVACCGGGGRPSRRASMRQRSSQDKGLSTCTPVRLRKPSGA
jgi:hypothetical protein